MSVAYFRNLGRMSYGETLARMHSFTDARDNNTPDEIWCVEHDPVFTLGQASDENHIHSSHNIPIVHTDRGGEVTFHGPGQAVIYPLLDLHRLQPKVYVHDLVTKLEQAAIDILNQYGIHGVRHPGAPGIYIANESTYGSLQGNKIAALGLKINRHGCCYHGIALNVSMDLSPFTWIDPCGYIDLAVTDMRSAGANCQLSSVTIQLAHAIAGQLGLTLQEN